jgi:hypothetical protein
MISKKSLVIVSAILFACLALAPIAYTGTTDPTKVEKREFGRESKAMPGAALKDHTFGGLFADTTSCSGACNCSTCVCSGTESCCESGCNYCWGYLDGSGACGVSQ